MDPARLLGAILGVVHSSKILGFLGFLGFFGFLGFLDFLDFLDFSDFLDFLEAFSGGTTSPLSKNLFRF